MNCPVCQSRTLATHNLDQDLVSWKCANCQGQWINSFQFSKWVEQHRFNHHDQPSSQHLELTSNETKSAKVCPECGRIMAKFKVGYSLPFSLDRCGNCGGIWFDKNEWEILQGSNLRDQIHLIFSAAWQYRVRHEEQARHLEELFKERVGEADFAEIKRVRDWLRKHPHRLELYGYLNNPEF
jgi:Zn-finger nucleic acid-binding protein